MITQRFVFIVLSVLMLSIIGLVLLGLVVALLQGVLLYYTRA